MKINTKVCLKNLKGDEIEINKEKFTLGDALAEMLIQSKTGGKMKMFTLAQKLVKDKTVEVDASDMAMIKEAVKTTEVYNALVAGQCELLLEEVKDK